MTDSEVNVHRLDSAAGLHADRHASVTAALTTVALGNDTPLDYRYVITHDSCLLVTTVNKCNMRGKINNNIQDAIASGCGD